MNPRWHWYPFTRKATFSICTERHFQTVAWGQKAPSVLDIQAAPLLSQFSLSSMDVSHSTGYREMLEIIISGEIFCLVFYKNKLFCFYSTCLNGRSANHLSSWRCVERSITPSVAALFVIQVTDFCQERWQKKIKIKTPGVQEREKSAGFSFQHLTVVSEQSCDHFSSALWTVLCDCQWFGHWGKQRASRKPGTQAWDSAALCQSTESWWLPSLSSWSLRTVTSRMSHVSGAWDVLAVTLPWGWLLHGKKGS